MPQLELFQARVSDDQPLSRDARFGLYPFTVDVEKPLAESKRRHSEKALYFLPPRGNGKEKVQ